MKVLYSIIIPLFNKEQYIVKCISSVINQSCKNFEIIVIDDGSTDQSAYLVNQIKHNRLTLIHQKNSGVSAARNMGMNKARGDFVCFLDADDWYEPTFLENIDSLINKIPAAEVYCSAYFKHNGNRISQSPIPSGAAINKFLLINDFYFEWSRGSFFFTSSICIRRNTLVRNKLFFPDNENLGEDQEMWFQLAERGPFAFTSQVLSNYTIGSLNSLTHQKKLIDEYPFFTRLKERVKSKSVGFCSYKSAKIFIASYELERSINNGLYGNKYLAIKLLLRHLLAFYFLKLKFFSLASILLPRFSISVLKKYIRKNKNSIS